MTISPAELDTLYHNCPRGTWALPYWIYLFHWVLGREVTREETLDGLNRLNDYLEDTIARQ